MGGCGEPYAGGGADPDVGSLPGYGFIGAVGSEGLPSPGGRGGSVMAVTVGPQLNVVESDMRLWSENRHRANAVSIIAPDERAT